MRTLYLCYLGLREPLVQTQVLPYLRELAAGGLEVSLLTFEPSYRRVWSEEDKRHWIDCLAGDGIRWRALVYHKRPSLPATVFDIIAGGLLAARLIRRDVIDVVHARGHISAAMGLLAKKLTGCRFIFDIRGFIPEEYVDGGVWPEGGLNYRLAKRTEQRCMRAADGFVVLTRRARDILFPRQLDEDCNGRPVEVIPCCVDFSRFERASEVSRAELREKLGVTARRVVVYVGKLGGWYLTREMVEFLRAAHDRDSSTFSLILTQSDPSVIEELFKKRGVDQKHYSIRSVPPQEVPVYLKAADLAVSFIKPCYSKLSSSPTKLAEYLAAGLPVVCNSGIGDVDEIIQGDRTGVILRDFTRAAYVEALAEAEKLLRDQGLRQRCSASARRRFDLTTVGGAAYRRLYSRVLESDAAALVASQALL